MSLLVVKSEFVIADVIYTKSITVTVTYVSLSFCIAAFCLKSNDCLTPPSQTRQNGLVLSCPRRLCELNWWQDKTALSRPSFQFAAVQSQAYWGLLKTVLTCRQFSSHRRRGQDKIVALSWPCQRCEIGVKQTCKALVTAPCHFQVWSTAANL